jgi:CBS domain-containing protein
MPYQTGQHAESMYFIPVGKVCRRPPVVCFAENTVRDASQLMQEKNITCVVVAEIDAPKGIFTVRDLRRVTAECSGNPADLTLRECMTPKLITLHEDACLFDAISLMSRHNFHRVGVVDAAGELVGMLTDTDLLTFQTRSPLYLITEIERASTIEQLQSLNAQLFEMIDMAYKAGVEIRGVVHLLAHFNDAFTQRLIQLLAENEGIVLPEGAAYLSLGSEGRGEQTFRTDQDSAMVYGDDFPPERMPALEQFAERLIAGLEQLGVPRCPGDTMASNPQWRHSLSDWKNILETWIGMPLQDNMVNFGMFQDMRVLYGDQSFEADLRSHIFETAKSKSLFFPSMARNIVRFKPPMGMFGRLLVEKMGPCRGKLDLKKGGLFAMVRGVGLLALEVGIVGGNTWDKIGRLRSLNLVAPGDLDDIEESFSTLVRMRLGRQLSARRANQEADNCIDPLVMTERSRKQLRAALKGVDTLLQILRSHYKLDMIAR